MLKPTIGLSGRARPQPTLLSLVPEQARWTILFEYRIPSFHEKSPEPQIPRLRSDDKKERATVDKKWLLHRGILQVNFGRSVPGSRGL